MDMKEFNSEVVCLLREILKRVDVGVNSLDQINYIPLDQRRRWTKQEVFDEFNISDSTYKRHISTGLLCPMRFTGGDEYFEEDLLKAMEESRRRGRI